MEINGLDVKIEIKQMKTLYESILSSTKSGVKSLIIEWCEENKIFNGYYELNDKMEIARKSTKRDTMIFLDLQFITYTKLPSYIKFADDENLSVHVGVHAKTGLKLSEVDSFEGIPKVCKNLTIFSTSDFLPDLKVKANHVSINLPNLKPGNFGKIDIDFFGKNPIFRLRELGNNVVEMPKLITLKNVGKIELKFSEELGKSLSSLLTSTNAPLNVYFPAGAKEINDKGVMKIENFLGSNVDTSNLTEIICTKKIKIVKKNEKWYRCKNS